LSRPEFKYNPIDLIPDKAVGIKLPFTGKKGLFDLSYTTEEQAMSNLKNLVLTRKGERLYHPNFGTAVYDILFEQVTDSLFEDIETSLREDIEFWMPYLIIDDIIAEPLRFGDARVDDVSNGIKIRITVRVTENGANQTIIVVFGNSQAILIE
jgi:phage baseplate assembly protein W